MYFIYLMLSNFKLQWLQPFIVSDVHEDRKAQRGSRKHKSNNIQNHNLCCSIFLFRGIKIRIYIV